MYGDPIAALHRSRCYFCEGTVIMIIIFTAMCIILFRGRSDFSQYHRQAEPPPPPPPPPKGRHPLLRRQTSQDTDTTMGYDQQADDIHPTGIIRPQFCTDISFLDRSSNLKKMSVKNILISNLYFCYFIFYKAN